MFKPVLSIVDHETRRVVTVNGSFGKEISPKGTKNSGFLGIIVIISIVFSWYTTSRTWKNGWIGYWYSLDKTCRGRSISSDMFDSMTVEGHCFGKGVGGWWLSCWHVLVSSESPDWEWRNTVDGSEIPNNHLECIKPCIFWGVNCLPTGAGFLPSTAPPWKLTCHLKRDHLKRKWIFQPSFFRGYVTFRVSTWTMILLKLSEA